MHPITIGTKGMTGSCDCGHSNPDHQVLHYASGRVFLVCNGLGVEKRPIEPGSTTMCTHRNCRCRINLTPKVYLVMAKDTRTDEKFFIEEYDTKEKAEGRVKQLDIACDDVWCDHHVHWVDEC